MKVWTVILAGVLGAVLATSCRRMPAFISFCEIEGRVWDSRDTARVALPAFESDVDGKVNVGVRTTGAFRYRKLSLLVTLRDSLGATVGKDTVDMEFDSSLGFPYAETWQPTRREFRLKAGMAHRVEITHIMKSADVEGIHAVGFEIE